MGWRLVNPRFAAADREVPDGHRTVTLSMGETAEEVAALDGITRAESDAFALRSHQRAVAAIDAGRFAPEIVPVPVGDREVTADEGPRRDTTPDKLAALRPVFRPDGIVTAGSSSAAVRRCRRRGARERGRGGATRAHARALGWSPRASAGVSPHLMGLGPVPATEKVLDRAGWRVDDLDAVELNEAFAAQSLAVIRRLKLDEELVNADGGAIALGHPLGCSGARLVTTLLGRLERDGGRRGLATLCVGVGQGVSLLVERV